MRENLRPAPGINTPHSLHPTTEAARPPLLSVVIACNERPDSLARCIEAVRESCREIATELIVVSSLAGPSVNDSISRYAGVRAIMLNEEALVPHLWAEGIARANGSIIALTISQCVPVREWAGAMVGSISKGAAAAGGPLSLHSDASNVDAAIFFLRYSAVLPGRMPSSALSIAGDNSAYSREILDGGKWSRETGFSEIAVNEDLQKNGKTIDWIPQAEVQFKDAGSLAANARRRFEHGRHFGSVRTREHHMSAARVVLQSPFVPFVLFGRTARRVAHTSGYMLRLLKAVPAFFVLSSAWACGEAVGAIAGTGIANRN